MARLWHLSHADGREWTRGELQELAERLRSESRFAPYDELLVGAVIDAKGYPWLMCDYRDYPIGDEPDVEVVFE